MRYLCACACALALAVLAAAAPPDVPKEYVAESGEVVEVVVKVKAGTSIGWRVAGDGGLFREVITDQPGEKVYWFTAKQDGVYPIVFWTVGEKASSITFVRVGPPPPKPQPGPGPGPGPNPKPGPVAAGKRFVLLIEESGDAVAGRGAMFADPVLAARFKANGHRWRVVDKDNRTAAGAAPADVEPYLKEAAGKKLPRLYIVAPDGTVCWLGDAPTGGNTAADILKLLEASGG
jgi:hypothetical protein